MGAPAPLLWTTTAQASYPPDDGVTIANVAGNYSNSLWGEVIPATTTAWKITGLYFIANSGALGYTEFDIGMGAAGAESVVATVSGYQGTGSVLPLPVPGTWIPSGARVAIRLRTNTQFAVFTFTVGVTYQPAPFTGVDASSTAPVALLPSVVVTPPAASGGLAVTSNVTAWVPGAWVAFDNPVPSAMTLGGLFSLGVQSGSSVHAAQQFDIGIGASGAQTVLTSVRWASEYVNLHSYCVAKLWPMVTVPEGSQLWCRVRDTMSTAEVARVALYLYPTTSGFSTVSTTQATIWAPASTDGVTLTSAGSAWANGSWVEVLAATTTPAAALKLMISACPRDEAEIDVGIGASGSETVLTTFRTTAGTLTNLTDHCELTLAAGIPIAQGVRLALRVRSAATASTWRTALGYIESPTFDQIDTTPQQVYPPAGDGIACDPGDFYVNSDWEEIVDATASAIRITGVSCTYTGSEWVLVDIASGESGSEVVLTTIRVAEVTAILLWFPLVTPYYVEQGIRLSVRVRQSSNTVGSRRVALTYLGVASLPPQPPPPATTRTPIRFVRQGPTLADEDGHKNVRFDRIELLCSQGLGAQTVQVQWSDNNGYSWSALQTFMTSEIGEYQARAYLWQLGTSRERIFRIIHTDAVPLVILDALMSFRVLGS